MGSWCCVVKPKLGKQIIEGTDLGFEDVVGGLSVLKAFLGGLR